MNLIFSKYHGTGNDFILVDNRDPEVVLSRLQIANLCHRRFGIGADGLILLEKDNISDFYMKYYNADGSESTMCGNGGRCIAAFAHYLGLVKGKAEFRAIDGIHVANIDETGLVRLGMSDVANIERNEDHVVLNTGSPHFVKWVSKLDDYPVFEEGRKVRLSSRFNEGGINVNFVEWIDDCLHVRTYERGVEDETLSCGTGVTAAAIAASGCTTGQFETKIMTPGGHLSVSFFKITPYAANNVVLSGPAQFVFRGEVKI